MTRLFTPWLTEIPCVLNFYKLK